MIWITFWLTWCEMWLARHETQFPSSIPPPPPSGAKVINLEVWRRDHAA